MRWDTRRALALAMLALGGYLAACGSPLVGAPCEANCVDGPCTTDADCLDGHVCSGGTCAPPPQCAANADCPNDEVCKAGTCVVPAACHSDADCACDKGSCIDGACSGPPRDCTNPAPIPCARNADCPEKTVCVGDVCRYTQECTANRDCPPGNGCYAHLCYAL